MRIFLRLDVLVASSHDSGLAACVAMLFINTAFYCLFLEGPGYSYIAEIWPNHFRGQGFSLSMAMFNISCIIWLQSAPTAFTNIGWNFYLLFIITGSFSTVVVLLFYPDTLHKPLEEIAAIFGDSGQVAILQKDLDNEQNMKQQVFRGTVPGESSNVRCSMIKRQGYIPKRTSSD